MEAKFRQKKKKVSYGKSSRDVLTEAALREELAWLKEGHTDVSLIRRQS